jgi:uncharacterized membrane protein YoaK (UPF0700 family)
MKNLQLSSMKNEPTPGEIPVYERPDFYYIVLGGAILSMWAGYINVIFITHLAFTVSHNTGTTSKMAMHLAKFELSNSFDKFLVLLAYLVGSSTIGFFNSKTKFYYSRKYGFFMMAEALMLFIATYLIEIHENFISIVICSYAMGLQNALFTNFSGAVVRTTHVTGLLTDIGLILGHKLRGREKTTDLWRLKVLTPLFIGFVGGGFLASFAFDIMGVKSMYFPVAFLGFGGLIWTVWRLRYQRNQNYKEIYDKL